MPEDLDGTLYPSHRRRRAERSSIDKLGGTLNACFSRRQTRLTALDIVAFMSGRERAVRDRNQTPQALIFRYVLP